MPQIRKLSNQNSKKENKEGHFYIFMFKFLERITASDQLHEFDDQIQNANINSNNTQELKTILKLTNLNLRNEQ